MGAYVNPTDTTKELWLVNNGKMVSSPFWDVTRTHLPVCLVDNGMFKAAGICFDKDELNRFMQEDGRPKTWFICPTNKLHEVSPELKHYLKV